MPPDNGERRPPEETATRTPTKESNADSLALPADTLAELAALAAGWSA